MEKVIKIKSSSSNEIYNVVFKIDNNLISINCNCKAGFVKILCRHRLSLIDGDYSAILNKGEVVLLNEIFNETNKSKIANLFAELNSVEKDIKKLDALKKKKHR